MTPSPNNDLAFRDVCNALEQRDSFVVTSHVRPDGDAMGSSVALALALCAAGKRARVVMRDHLPIQFMEFPSVDEITCADEIPDDDSTVVVLECGDLERTGLRGLERHPVINIDHHPGNSGFGAVQWFDGAAVACGEMVYAVISELGIPLTSAMATHLYVAIVTDTGSFRYPGVSPRTFDICARLLEAGADPVAIARHLFDGSTLGRLRLQGAVLTTLEIHNSGTIASMSVNHATIAATGATPEETDGLINIPLSVKQINAVAFFKEGDHGEYRVSLRSKGITDVGRIARDFGGGGHRNASGCTLGGSLADVRARILQCLVDEVHGIGAGSHAPESRTRD
jgi:phosphoesterase RecJ-like protein